MIEIRWHGRGGQGAKTASQLLALAELTAGREVQAFPEYGPERSGAPMTAYNRINDVPIRRHDGITHPNFVVVLDDSLLGPSIVDGLSPRGLLLVNTRQTFEPVHQATGYEGPIWCVPAGKMIQERGLRHGNVVMVGAMAAALHLALATVEEALRQAMAKKLGPAALENTLWALREGHAWGEGRCTA